MKSEPKFVTTMAGAVAAIALLAGCGVRMNERHYFAAAVDPSTNEISNVYRLSVSGSAGMANARYIAGYYDERAVDLFFNEVKASDLSTTPGSSVAPGFFNTTCSGTTAEACREERERRLSMVPAGGADGSHGAFVLLLSTNADAIATTIGQFAENEANLRAAMFLATRDTQEDAAIRAATAPLIRQSRGHTQAELSTLVTTATNSDTETAWLAVLRATASSLAPTSPPTFATMDEARAWFASQPREVRP